MARVECLDILNQLKLTAMSFHRDDIVTGGIKCKRVMIGILHNLLKAEQV